MSEANTSLKHIKRCPAEVMKVLQALADAEAVNPDVRLSEITVDIPTQHYNKQWLSAWLRDHEEEIEEGW